MLIARLPYKATINPLPTTATCDDVTTDRAESWAVAVRRHVPRTPKDVSATDLADLFTAMPKRAGSSMDRRFDCATGSNGVSLRGLTFELSGRQRQDARPGLAKMYRVPPDRAWWPAVGAPLERGVRRQRATAELTQSRSDLDVLDLARRRRQINSIFSHAL